MLSYKKELGRKLKDYWQCLLKEEVPGRDIKHYITLYFLHIATISGSWQSSPSILYMPSTTTIIFFHGLCVLGCPSAICSLKTFSKCDGAKEIMEFKAQTWHRTPHWTLLFKWKGNLMNTYCYVEKHEWWIQNLEHHLDGEETMVICLGEMRTKVGVVRVSYPRVAIWPKWQWVFNFKCYIVFFFEEVLFYFCKI